MAPPLAGKPPFATDQPDSLFANQPQSTSRLRKQQQMDATAPGGARDSAYNAFDSYFTGGNAPDPRASGVGDIGRGLLNAGSDYDDSSDDEQPQRKQQPPPFANDQPSDKHRALFAAATGAAPSELPPPSYDHGASVSMREKHTPAPLQPSSNVRTVKQPQAVVHARNNNWHVSQHLEPSTPPGAARSMTQQQQQPPMPLQAGGGRTVAAPAPSHLRQPQAAFMQGQDLMVPPHSPGNPYFNGSMPGSPISPTSRTPQPLPPPQSPIMPVFARPRKQSNAVQFDEKGILRGDSEETLLARGGGGKGDEFWRRFSMVAKEEARGGSKKSAWLKKTENGTTRLSTWVWLVSIIILIAIGAAIGVGWYFTHNKPASQPVAIGGSANEGFTSTSSIAQSSASVKATKVTAAPAPTNTSNNSRRNASPVVPPAHRRSHVSRNGH